MIPAFFRILFWYGLSAQIRNQITWKKISKISFFLCLAILNSSCFSTKEAQLPIRLHPDNEHYFLFRKKPAILISSSEHYGAVLNLDFDYITYLETLSNQGLNYARIFSGSYVESAGNWDIEKNTLAPAAERFISPWARSNIPGYFKGGNKFNLEKWDRAYFKRLKDFVSRAGKLNIVVEITLFSSYYREEVWKQSPLNSNNNINGIDSINRFNVNTLDNGNLSFYQENLVRKIVRELNKYDNVIYEVQNEPWADNGIVAETVFISDTTLPDFLRNVEIANPAISKWHKKMASIIKDEESRLKYQHLIAENISNSHHKILNPDSNISIFNFHLALPDAVYENYQYKKAIGFDESGFYGSEDETYRKQAWNFILAGGALYNGLDYSFTVGSPEGKDVQKAPGGGSWKLRNQLKVLKDFMNSFDFIKMKPDSNIFKEAKSVAGKRSLVSFGKEYAIYVQGNNTKDIKIDLPAGVYHCEWINTENGSIKEKLNVTHEGGMLLLSIPSYSSDIALKIHALKK